MQKILLSALLVLQTICYSQAPLIEWQKNLGGSLGESAYSFNIKQAPDGGYIVVGSTKSTDGDITFNHGDYDYWVVKLNPNGNIDWQKTYGGTGSDIAYAVDLTNDGGYIICGSTGSTDGDVTVNHGPLDVWVIKISSLGNLEWQKSLGGTRGEIARSIQTTNDGGYILCGVTNSNNGDVSLNFGLNDYWVVKLDSTGTIQWQKTFGGTGYDSAWNIKQTADNGYIVCGYTDSREITGAQVGILTRCFVIKLNAVGVVQWRKTYGDSENYGFSIREANDGGYIFVGRFDYYNPGSNIGETDSWIVKIDNIGDVQWEKKYRGTGVDDFRDILPTLDNGYIIAGFSSSNDNDFDQNHGQADYCLFKIDHMGNKLWQKALGGSGYDVASSVLQTSDGGYLISGTTDSTDGDLNTNNGLVDICVVRLTPESLQTKAFDLSGMIAYPNPVNNYINIQLHEGIEIDKITILDITGKVIMKDKGKQRINTQNLPSGSYILQAFSGTKKYESKFIKQ